MTDNAPPNSALRGSRSLLKWGLRVLVAVAILLVLFSAGLSTPAGQRWAVQRAVRALHGALFDEAGGHEIHVEGVALSAWPAGIRLTGIQWMGGQDSLHVLAQLASLTAMPNGWSGTDWSSLDIQGLRWHAAAWDHLPEFGRAGGTASDAGEWKLNRLTLADITIEFTGQEWAGHSLSALTVKTGNVQGLALRDGRPGWQDFEATTAFDMKTPSGSALTVPMNWTGTPNALITRGNIPEAWPIAEPLDLPSQWQPTSWFARADLQTQSAVLETELQGGRVRMTGQWTADSVRLDTLKWTASRSGPWIPGAPAGIGFLDLSGPLVLHRAAHPDAPETAGAWSNLMGDVSAEGRWSSPDNGLMRLHADWTAETGNCLLRLSVPSEWMDAEWGHDATLDMRGQVAEHPLWQPFQGGQLEGTWQLSPGLDRPGTIQGQGDWTAALERNDRQDWALTADLSGELLPLSVARGLDLFGAVHLAGELQWDSTGSLGPWWGHLDVTDSRWIPQAGFGQQQRNAAPLSMERFSVRTQGDEARFTATLDGDFLRGHAEGPLHPQGWLAPFQHALDVSGLVAFPQARIPSDSQWSVQLDVLRDDLLERWSAGQQSIGSGSTLRASHAAGDLEVELNLTALHHREWRSGPLRLVATDGHSAIGTHLSVTGLQHGDWGRLDTLLLDADVSAATESDVALQWTGPTSGDVRFHHRILDGWTHEITPASIGIQHSSGEWNLEADLAPAVLWQGADWRSLRVRNFELKGPLGALTLDSPPRQSDEEVAELLELHADGVPLAALTDWMQGAATEPIPSLGGTLNAEARLDLRQERLWGEVQWQDAVLEEYTLGDVCAQGRWGQGWHVGWQQEVKGTECLTGTWGSNGMGHLMASNWPLDLLQPLFGEETVTLSGTASGRVDLAQRNGLPVGRGELAVQADTVFIHATGTGYGAQGLLRLEDGFLGIDRGRITDPSGRVGWMNLSVQHTDYAGWNYDIGLDVSDEPMLVLDLPPAPQSRFYGQAVASGFLNVFGDGARLELESELDAAEGTQFVLPLDALEGADIPSGIRLVGRTDSDTGPLPSPSLPFQWSMDLDLGLTPEAALSIVLDGASGERLDGRTQGRLRIQQTPDLPLSVTGGLDIVEGQYRFSLRDLFTKRIAIAPGGRLDWDGDPFQADLDLLARSEVRTSPAPLLPGLINANKTTVEVGMGIRGSLTAPELNFQVELPDLDLADPSLSAQVRSVLSTPEEMERQSFALLATGQFIAPGGQEAVLTQTAASQASDLVSSRISELLSGLSEDVDIGVRYVPAAADVASGADALTSSTDAFELDLGLQLMNDRLRISGTVGTDGLDSWSGDGTDFRGGVDVRYQLTADGRWELQGFRLPESVLEEETKQGIGAAYQLRFDRLRDLFRSPDKETVTGE